jgi:hypothetical protein
MQWFANMNPHFIWPIMLIVGVIAMALIWKVAGAMYEQLSGILAGAGFMIVGLGLVLYCAFYLMSHPFSNLALFANGVGILAGISAVGAGGYGLRNASDF